MYVSETGTPDIAEIGAIVNGAFLIDRLFRDGVFGLFK